MIALLSGGYLIGSEKININSDETTQFMQLAKVYIRDKLRPLNTIRYILNPSLIPSDVEALDNVLSYNISKNFDKSEIKEYFQWVESPLINWTRLIAGHLDLEVSPAFAKKVHKILANGLYKINNNDKNEIHQLFVDKICIPTTHGMKKPKKAYCISEMLICLSTY